MTLGDYITLGILAAGTFGLLRLAYRRYQPRIHYYLMAIYYAIDDYVWVSQSHQAKELIAKNRQSYAVNQPQTAPVQPPKPRFEPRFTKRELVQFLATATLVEDDGTSHPLSQEAISRAAGISKVTAAVMIAEARGETVRASDPYQFEPVNGNVNMSRRTGVKPLR